MRTPTRPDRLLARLLIAWVFLLLLFALLCWGLAAVPAGAQTRGNAAMIDDWRTGTAQALDTELGGIATSLAGKQPLDSDLTCIAALATTGFVNRTGAGTCTAAGLVATDIPSLDWSKITTGKPTTLAGYGITDAQGLDCDLTSLAGASSVAIYYRSAACTWGPVTIGSGVAFSGGTLSATGTGGTVTSVGLSSTDFTVSGSPVTGSGTITANLATQAGIVAAAYGDASHTLSLTVNSKGVATSLTTNPIAINWSAIAAGKPTTLVGYGVTGGASLDALGGVSWSAGTQVPALTAANVWGLKPVGSGSGNLLDKAAGDALYLGLTATAADSSKLGGALAGTYALLASPTFTGTPAAPTATAGTNTTQVATTAFVQASSALLAPLASPTFTGTPAAPTATVGTNTTQLATTAFVQAAAAPLAPLASPALTGTPTAPTAALLTNTTQIATTAFVQSAVGGTGTVTSVGLSSTDFTVSGSPVTGSGSITANLATQAGITAGAYGDASHSLSATVNSKGVLTALSSNSIAIGWSQITSGKPTTLVGYGVTGGASLDALGGVSWSAGTQVPALTAANVWGLKPVGSGSGNLLDKAAGDALYLGLTATAADSSKLGGALAGTYAPLASPTFTGTPAAPTATAGTNTTQVATTAFVQASSASLAPLASPALTGTPTAPTASAATNTTQLATTAFVQAAAAPLAPLASPALTGTPTAPTAALLTNTTQIASTAFVQTALGGYQATSAKDLTAGGYPSFSSGTWTPTVSFATAGTSSFTYSAQFGQYVQIGNLVYLDFFVTFTPTIGTGSGVMRINGLPFPLGADLDSVGAVRGLTATFTWPAGCTMVALASTAAGASLSLSCIGSGAAPATMVATNLTSGSAHTIGGTLIYRK